MSDVAALWQRYKQQMDTDARQQIILSYSYLTKYVVDRMHLRQSAVLSYDDLLGYAIIGLIDAVEKFDPGRDIKFETYAVVRIRGAVLDAIKSLDWTPRAVRATESEMRRAFAEIEALYNRPATDEEVAAAMGMDIDQLNDALADIGQSAMLSLEDLLTFNEEPICLKAHRTHENDPAIAAEMSERRRLLASAIESLPEKEKLVVSLYYREGLTLKEIAAVLGVTESRACQLHSKSMMRLQGKLARHADLLQAAA
jgi:RNA polymerase sigma factor FliA